jgi:hypothetical protein
MTTIAPVTDVVDDLVAQGTRGFRASYVAKRAGLPPAEVQRALSDMVDQGKLDTRFEVLCPDDKARTAATFNSVEDVPIGQELHSTKCESDEPFRVSDGDVWITFVPTREYASGVVRRTQGKVPPARRRRPSWLRLLSTRSGDSRRTTSS